MTTDKTEVWYSQSEGFYEKPDAALQALPKNAFTNTGPEDTLRNHGYEVEWSYGGFVSEGGPGDSVRGWVRRNGGPAPYVVELDGGGVGSQRIFMKTRADFVALRVLVTRRFTTLAEPAGGPAEPS